VKENNLFKKIKNLSSHFFELLKTNCDDYGQKVKKQCFSKLFLGFDFWTFLKMSNFHFPFYFLKKFYKFLKINKKIKKNHNIFSFTWLKYQKLFLYF
jgi:hypothetical protein